MAAKAGAAPEPRKYRFVVWHKSAPQGWLAQIPCPHGLLKQKTLGSPVATQLEAARVAASALGRSVASLTLSKPASHSARRKITPPSHVSGWQYVYWHRGSRRWEARVSGETLGYHATETAAAAQAVGGGATPYAIDLKP